MCSWQYNVLEKSLKACEPWNEEKSRKKIFLSQTNTIINLFLICLFNFGA